MGSRKRLNEIYHPVQVPLSCNTTLSDFKHHCLPGLNLVTKERDISSIEEISKLYDELPISSGKPLPCLVDLRASEVGNEDPVLKLVREKYFWQRRKTYLLDLIHRRYKGKKSLKIDSINLKKTKKITKLPYVITRLADHLSKNPDKNFKGLYNWYFDNALTTIKFSEQQYLLHAGGEFLNNLCISSIDLDATSPSIPVVTPKFNIPLTLQDPIFHIFSSPTNDRIGIRQRDSCTFFIFEKDCKIKKVGRTTFSLSCGNNPFVGADIAEQEICTLSSNRHMKLWDLTQQSCISEASLPQSNSFLSDKFARVQFSRNDNSIIVIDRKNIYSFDTRSSLATPSSRWSCDNYVEICENLSLMVPSTKNDNYFIGSTHSCLLLDNRFGFVQKWFHMIPQTPAVGHAVDLDSNDSKELFTLCSQSGDDVISIYNNTSASSSITCSPFSLPDRNDTLQEARSCGILYQPVLQNKFDFSVIGLTSCEISQRSTLFSLISTGDIFQQKLKMTTSRSNGLSKEHLSYLENWENNIIKVFSNRKNPRHVVTHTFKMNDLLAKLDKVEIPEWKTEPADLKKVQKFTKKELQSYTDLLAPNLLNDYGVLDDSDWEDEEDDIDLSAKSVDKVQNWLQRTNESEFSQGSNKNDLDNSSLDGIENSDFEEDEFGIENTSILSFELSDDEL